MRNSGYPPHSRRWLAAFSLALLGLAACTHIPLRSLWALRQLDLQQVDPSHLRAVAWLPPELEAQRDAVRVHIKAERGGDSKDTLESTLVLRPQAGEPKNMTAPNNPGRWVLLSLDAEQQQRFAQLRQQLQAWKAADGDRAKRRLQMDFSVDFCQRPGGRPATALADAPVSAWLRWRADQEDVQLLDEARLKDVDERLSHKPYALCDAAR